jgi:coenzyme F420-0:L-glutamate ligase/coenzyme F420-1:gamma-L-glutamate ligase
MESELDIHLIPLRDLPEIEPGDDLGMLIAAAAQSTGVNLLNGDVLVVAQKIVSKSEGRLVDLAAVTPSARALEIAERQHRDPRLIEVILSESARLVRQDAHVLITETKHGFVCANAGVDKSNVPGKDWVSLLPVAPDESARRLAARLSELLRIRAAVIITDTFGRAWREGLTNAAIGVAGLQPLKDYRGETDDHGKELSATVLAVADEIAAASGLLMRKTARIPAVIVRGFHYESGEAGAASLIRPKERDLFR